MGRARTSTPNCGQVRVMLKTAPMEQWAVARELRQRIKARFDHEGIEIPLPQRVVWHRGDPTRWPAATPVRRSGTRQQPFRSVRRGGVERDRGAGQRLAHRAVLLGVLGGGHEVLVARCPRPSRGR